MFRLITAATALAVLVACDSEGIDRSQTTGIPSENIGTANDANTSGSATGQVASDGISDANTLIVPNDGVVEETTDTVIVVGGTDTGETGTTGGTGTTETNPNATNPLGGSGSSDGGLASTPETNPNATNPLGGSGSSDGGVPPEETVVTEQPANDDPTPTVDASLSTEAPVSGTTYVSTMGPITSDNGPLCLRPQKDALGNVIMNEAGNCPLLQYHGNLAFGDFILATNAWNYCASSFTEWEQCVSVNESQGAVKPRWDYDWGEEFQVNGQVWLVKSYPEIVYGIKSPGEYSGSTLAETPAETGLPAKVSEMPFYKIDYAFSSEEYPTRGKDLNGQRINGERNIAVEAFFHELSGECDPTSLIRDSSASNQRFEIMVWLDAGAERLPAAPSDYVTTQTLDGVEYDIYTKPSDAEYIAFVSKSPTASGSINWTTFVEWTRANSHRVNEVFGRGFNTVQLQDDWCMANILLGTEIWWGNGYFQADEWTISRTIR